MASWNRKQSLRKRLRKNKQQQIAREGTWTTSAIAASSSAGFFLHFLFKCTEKGIFLLKITEKEEKTGPAVGAAVGSTERSPMTNDRLIAILEDNLPQNPRN